MAEVAEEAPEAEAEEPESERPLEREIEDADVEQSPMDRKIYSRIDNKYSKSIEYKKASKESSSKKFSAKSSGLERVIDDSSSKDETRKIHDSSDGGHVIPYHRDPKTGKVYLAFEIKPPGYKPAKYAGIPSLYGGALKIGEPPNEGLSRELMEEDPAHKIVIEALNETRWKIAEITKNFDGVPSTFYIWAAEIKDPIKWAQYVSSKSIEGDKVIKSLEEISGMANSDFAWVFGPVVKEVAGILSDSYPKISAYSLGKENKFMSKIYADSIVPKHADLSMQILNSKDSKQYKTQFQISNSFYNPN